MTQVARFRLSQALPSCYALSLASDLGKSTYCRKHHLTELNRIFFPSVAVVGNVDAGKSTLLGVLTHGELDNGRGFARQKLFRHKHEMESGRTSSVGNDILGFDGQGNVINKSEVHGTHCHMP